MIQSLENDQLVRLRQRITNGESPRKVLPNSIGGTELCNGLWRFFSSDHPKSGVDHWNEEWCTAWGLSTKNVFVCGEDIFGNQLILPEEKTTVYLCNHENGSCDNLDLGIADLLEACLRHGLSWIDFYSDGSLNVAQSRLSDLTWEQHLHWTQPLILGGEVALNNLSIVDRFVHLAGHAKLWKQLSGLPTGVEVRIQ
jgi:hypothetical protein